MSRFVMASDVETATFDWGSAGMRCATPGTGCTTFVVMDVTLTPGGAHAFHKHPDQDEMIIVKSGRVRLCHADSSGRNGDRCERGLLQPPTRFHAEHDAPKATATPNPTASQLRPPRSLDSRCG